METWIKNLMVIIPVFKVLQRAGSHKALSHPPASSFLCVVCSLHSVCCPSPPHCSSGVNQNPAGWSTLPELKVTLVSTKITQNSLQEAPWLLFSSQARRTCQRIQIISCFTATEWNTNARVDLLIVSMYKVCKTWNSHLLFSFPWWLFAVRIPCRWEDCTIHLNVLELIQMLHKAETEDRNEDMAKQALESPFVEPDLKMEVHELPMDQSSSPRL